jgi:hypothetical protein
MVVIWKIENGSSIGSMFLSVCTYRVASGYENWSHFSSYCQEMSLFLVFLFNLMATSNSIFRAIFNNYCQCHCQFKIMNFNIEQGISIIKWYYPAKEGRSGRTEAVRVQDHSLACHIS